MNIFSTFANFQGKLRGMHEHSVNVTLPSAASDVKTVTQRIYQSANVLQVKEFSNFCIINLNLFFRSQAVMLTYFCLPARRCQPPPWSWSASTWRPPRSSW